MSCVFSFPVVCFTVTVHRSQGQTLNRVVFYLHSDVFMHGGCLYVGLSRVRKSADTRIWATEDRICSYTLCAKAVHVVYSSLIPESRWINVIVVFVCLLLLLFLLSSCCPCVLLISRCWLFLLRWLLFIIIFLPFSILVRMISFCFFLLLNLLHARIHDVATLRRFHVRYPTRLLAPPCKHVPWWTRRPLL